MRKLPAAAQEERRRQVVGLRQSGLTYDAIAAQVGLTRTGVFNICRRFAEQGLPGLASGPRGPAPGTGRCLTAEQEAQVRALISQHTPDELGLPFARACHVVERGRDEVRIGQCQAATPAALRHASNASARKRRWVRAETR